MTAATTVTASADAHPFEPTRKSREFFTSSEKNNRCAGDPEIAALTINPDAPASSLVALAIARTCSIIPTLNFVGQHVFASDAELARVLYSIEESVDEIRQLLEELQSRNVTERPEASK